MIDGFLALAKATHEAVLIHEGGNVREVNPALMGLVGFARDEVVGHDWVSTLVAPQSHDAIAKGEPGEIVLVTKSGERTTVLWRAEPFVHEGKSMHVVALQDTTERQLLERRIAERTAELIALQEELDAFASSVSHDLRAPLRHVSGFAELLERSSADKLTDEGRRHLAIVMRASRRMHGLIDDLLLLSRAGRATMEPSLFSSAEVVDHVRQALGARGVGVAWSVAPLPEVYADRPSIISVFTQLIDNAVKYSRGRPAEVAISSETRDEEWQFHVTDNGVGFDPRYVDQLFGVFRRLHRDEQFEGNGIGLAIVRRLVHRHGGKTWARAEPEKGATFSFSLPMRKVPR